MIYKVEGVDYSKEGIEELKDEIIKYRDASMNQWPEAIPVTIVLTHTIALLHYLIELQEEYDKASNASQSN